MGGKEKKGVGANFDQSAIFTLKYAMKTTESARVIRDNRNFRVKNQLLVHNSCYAML
jgi:hypothetical protein